MGTRSITCSVPGRDPRTFTYDHILWQTPQTEMFEGTAAVILILPIATAPSGTPRLSHLSALTATSLPPGLNFHNRFSIRTPFNAVAGLPMVDNVVAGYNSSIFAYGQTGAGKTYTMLGALSSPGDPPAELVSQSCLP